MLIIISHRVIAALLLALAVGSTRAAPVSPHAIEPSGQAQPSVFCRGPLPLSEPYATAEHGIAPHSPDSSASGVFKQLSPIPVDSSATGNGNTMRHFPDVGNNHDIQLSSVFRPSESSVLLESCAALIACHEVPRALERAEALVTPRAPSMGASVAGRIARRQEASQGDNAVPLDAALDRRSPTSGSPVVKHNGDGDTNIGAGHPPRKHGGKNDISTGPQDDMSVARSQEVSQSPRPPLFGPSFRLCSYPALVTGDKDDNIADPHISGGLRDPQRGH